MSFEQNSKQNINNYLGFYSSYFDKYVTDLAEMVVPVDDHGFHRGDGVFEAIKWNQNQVWLLSEHIDRLIKSAKQISISLPWDKNKIIEIVNHVKKISEQGIDSHSINKPSVNQGMLRVYITRGPGNFGVSPYETLGTQLYVMATRFNPLPEEKYIRGVSVGLSRFEVKEPFWATTKTLNYLQNVWQKKESQDRGLDFCIGVTKENYIAESATENIAFFKQQTLIIPSLDYTLKGTTLNRLKDLILEGRNQDDGANNFEVRKISIETRDVSVSELSSMEEVMMVGTTLDVLPVRSIDQFQYPLGNKTKLFRQMLINDQQ